MMLEYTEYSKSAPIAINSKYVVTIQPDGNSLTRITLVSGKTVIIQGEYDKIIEHFIKY